MHMWKGILLGGKICIEFSSNTNGISWKQFWCHFISYILVKFPIWANILLALTCLSAPDSLIYNCSLPAHIACPPHPLGHTLHIRQINLWQIKFWPLYVSKFVFLPSFSLPLPSWLFSQDISSTNFMLCLFFSYLPASFFFSYILYITSYIISIISYILYR